MDYFRRLILWLRGLFHKTGLPSPDEKKLPPWRRKPSRLVKFYPGQHSYGFPNSPKRQPCWKCGKWVKRSDRSKTTATYECPLCNTVSILSLRGGG